MDFILPVRKGGLGNQMFQVAAAMVYSKVTGKKVVLPHEFYNSHNPTKIDYSSSVFKEFIHRIERPIDGTAVQLLLQQGFTQHPGEPGFEDWTVHDCSGNILLHGYFQCYPPLAPYEDDIRKVYLAGIGRPVKDLFPKRDRVGIHVRRGDYLNPPYSDVLYVQDISYYEMTLKNYSRDCEFWIFSDDVEWCRQQSVLLDLPHKVFIEEPHEIKALYLMSLCHGGFICANSSFSWWGAFLGAYAVRAPVCVPTNWFKGGVGNLFPPEWKVI
jgi:hypothetical protein